MTKAATAKSMAAEPEAAARKPGRGRIYDSIYLCRRWEGNTDSALPLETANRYDFYKDWIRTNEIRARQRR